MPLATALGCVLLVWGFAAPARISQTFAAVFIQPDQPPQNQPQPEAKPQPEPAPPPPAATIQQDTPVPEAKPDELRPPSQAEPPAEGPQGSGNKSTPPSSAQTPDASSNPKEASTVRKKTTTPGKAVASKKRTKKRSRRTTAQQEQSPAKVVVPHGSTADPTIQLTPTLNQQQASTQLQNTNHLLDSTDANLKKISNRQLNTIQQETVSQIRTYMEQAKVAVTTGDVQRANNLAIKAQLLSEELVKQ